MKKTLQFGFVALALSLFGAPAPALAQDATLKVVEYPEPDPEAETKPQDPAFIRGTFTSDQIGLAEKDFVLKLEEAEPKISVEAIKAVPYAKSSEPLALVILIQGDFSWMGNETYITEEDDTSKQEGAFTGLPAAVDAFKGAGPKGSVASIIIYGDAATVKLPMGDLSKLDGSVLGTQQDYQGISKSLVVGLDAAWKALAKSGEKRRVLVVMGSGVDTKEDIGPALKKAVGQLKDAKIETYTIRYSNDADTVAQGTANMRQIGYSGKYDATSRDHFASKAKNIAELIGAKYYVDFPGTDFPWDDKEHMFIPSVGGEDLDEIGLVLPKELAPAPPPSEGGLWWLWLLIVGAVVLVVVVIIIIARRKPKVAAPPPMMVQDVPPPEPAGPKKTVMFNLNAGSEYPVVGWIVPLSGPNQFQTFKLLHGATKIGTGGDSHIIINDGFMSTVHAEIVCKQSGFILVDGGSTNGSFVNDRKISEHELVDNDQFVLGKTPFKFKSIN